MTPVPTPDVKYLPPVSELLAWADNPASSGYVPVHPVTLRAIAGELTQSAERIAELVQARDESVRLVTAERERMDALVEKQADRIRVLTEALEKYGWHHDACDAIYLVPCSFGYAALYDIGAKPWRR